jgi:cullin 4
MQKSPVVSAPPDNEPRPSANDRKRKRRSSASDPSQKTISQLFTTDLKAQAVPTCFENGKTVVRDLSPSRKLYEPLSPPQKMPLDSMYSFPTRQPHNGVIDLTNSPESTPPQRAPKQTFNSHLGAKRIVVKNLRAARKTDPKQYLEQQWEKLDKALCAIFGNADKLPSSHEELYRGVQNVCNQGYAEILHTRLQAKATDYMMSEVKPLLENGIEQSPLQKLEVVLDAWTQWQAKFVSILASVS